MRRHERREPLCVFQNISVQVAGVGGENGRLSLNGRHHGRMRMAHVRHVVVHIEVGAIQRVVQPDSLAPHQVQWLIS